MVLSLNNSLPPLIYINIGLESADQETLDKIGKPISAHQVQQAFDRIQEINNRYNSIEITANFLMDETLPKNYYPKIIELIRDKQTFTKPKGTIYFSPLTFDKPNVVLVLSRNSISFFGDTRNIGCSQFVRRATLCLHGGCGARCRVDDESGIAESSNLGVAEAIQ